MSSLSISAAWDETKAILARDGKLIATVALALIVFPETVFAVVGAPAGPQASGVSLVSYFIVILLGCVAQIAINRLAIGQGVTVGSAIATGFRRLPSVAVVGILTAFAVLVIAIVLVLILSLTRLMAVPAAGQPPPPSLLLLLLVIIAAFFAIFQLVFPVAAVETGNPLRLISRAWSLSRGHYLRLLGFVVTIFLGLVLVVLALQLVLGSVIVVALGKPDPGTVSALVFGVISGIAQAGFTIILAVMVARIYLQLTSGGEAQASVPSSGI